MSIRILLIASIASVAFVACKTPPTPSAPAEVVPNELAEFNAESEAAVRGLTEDEEFERILKDAKNSSNKECKEKGIALGADCSRYYQSKNERYVMERRAALEYQAAQAYRRQCKVYNGC